MFNDLKDRFHLEWRLCLIGSGRKLWKMSIDLYFEDFQSKACRSIEVKYLSGSIWNCKPRNNYMHRQETVFSNFLYAGNSKCDRFWKDPATVKYVISGGKMLHYFRVQYLEIQ